MQTEVEKGWARVDGDFTAPNGKYYFSKFFVSSYMSPSRVALYEAGHGECLGYVICCDCTGKCVYHTFIDGKLENTLDSLDEAFWWLIAAGKGNQSK